MSDDFKLVPVDATETIIVIFLPLLHSFSVELAYDTQFYGEV